MQGCGCGALVVLVRETGAVYAWAGGWHAQVVVSLMEAGEPALELRVGDRRFVVQGWTPYELAHALRCGIVHAQREVFV